MQGTAPDLDSPSDLIGLFNFINNCRNEDLLLAYHDRSDGGLFTTLAEMAFAGHCGVDIQLQALGAEDNVPYSMKN